jgi:hypothetical protein
MADDPRNDLPDRPAAPLPVSLDRSALERVLARAAELQAGQAEPSEGMTEAQLVEVGKEVGIPPEHVRQALAEERTRVAVPEQRGLVGSLFGGEMASASRIVRGNAAQVLARIDEWMQREESLRPKRRYVDRLTWEARRDLVGNIKTSLNLGGRAYALSSADEVGATVVAIDDERCIVRLDADLRESRRRRVGWSAVAGGGLLASALALVGYTIVIPEASALVGSVVGGVWAATGAATAAGLAAAQRSRVARAQLALEQVLDQLEHGAARRPNNPLADLIEVVSRKSRF